MYIYGSFRVRVGKFLFLYVKFHGLRRTPALGTARRRPWPNAAWPGGLQKRRRRGIRTHDHVVNSHAVYQLS